MVKQYRLLVFATALATLVFELVISRLADYHLGHSYSYIALPITFLGLAAGSLHVHLAPKSVENFSAKQHLFALAGVSFASLMVAFVVFSRWMPATSALEMMERGGYLTAKTLAFVGVLVPPFYVFGRILTITYQLKRDKIAEVYSADFWGAAIACAITPLMFHYSGLPTVILALLVLTFIPAVVLPDFETKTRVMIGAGFLVVAVVGQMLMTWMDDNPVMDDYRHAERFTNKEYAHAWNEFSRVAVISRTKTSSGRTKWKIVHDNSRSNVKIRKWKGPYTKSPKLGEFEAVESVFHLGRPVEDVLVLFAGCGFEMTKYDAYTGGKGNIYGVELNPLVKELALTTPELKEFRLQEFHAQKHIHLMADEGRHYLSNDERKYDVIHIASNASTGGPLTGHSRKYLDTVEAYSLMLDRLKPHGVIIFDQQPLNRRILTMRKALEKRGVKDFAPHAMIFDGLVANDDMLVSMQAFSDDEILRMSEAAEQGKRVRWVPRNGPKRRNYDQLITTPGIDEKEVLTDDHPFLHPLYLDEYTLWPGERTIKKWKLFMGWLKITTLLLLTLISFLFIAVAMAFGSKKARPPVAALFYLLLTGFAFMLVEVALMAKLELFLQKPLFSMATVLTVFLATSGFGSSLFPKLRDRIHPVSLAGAVALVVFVCVYLVDAASTNLTGWPILLKLVVAALMVGPVGFGLGLFYPYLVGCLTKHGHDDAVAITYGVSTLSSVVGATYAMTFMIEFGFNALLWQATVLYVALAVFFIIYKMLGGKLLFLR